MEPWTPQLLQLDARGEFNVSLNNSAAQMVPYLPNSVTKSIIESLQRQKVAQLRTMHLTIGVFSLVVALTIVLRIVMDARRAAGKTRSNLIHSIHPAETFPLVLACGSGLQQIIFVAAQSTNLNNPFSNNCRGLAMVTLPAIFLTGYITLVFGIELALRAFRTERFAPRGKWNATICVGVVTFLVILTWMPTVAWPMYNMCVGRLIWFAGRYELIIITVLGILVVSCMTLAALVSIQLLRTSNMDPSERIAASRMCYYLVLAALVYALVIPVEVQAIRRDFLNTHAVSRMAEVALFSYGILIGFFHLLLRANASRMVISPINDESSASAQGKKRPKIRFFGPSDLHMTISGPLALQGGHRTDSRQGLIDVGQEKDRFYDPEYLGAHEKPLSPDSMRSMGSVDPTKWPLPPDPLELPVQQVAQNVSDGHKRTKSSYSLFPTRAEDIPRLPATVYTPPNPKPGNQSRVSNLALRRQARRSSLGNTKSVTDVSEAFNFLTKPPPLFSSRHRREHSTDSSATVQIGLRFSVAPATLAAAKCTAMNRQVEGHQPVMRREESDDSVETLGLPIQVPSDASSMTAATSGNAEASPSPMGWPRPPKGATTAVRPVQQEMTQRGKTLPPTPRSRPTSPPTAQTSSLRNQVMSGLRMNPISPGSSRRNMSPTGTGRSPPVRSPTAMERIPLGPGGTMASSPPPNGWI
ncbi:hypothetical protein M011DRAFT_408485 [Sporormia fimetaria CBS 119925]|uniref:Uncharacterized protein n=1 Tax=Sporormia fimetaria CBS 119925 TaxID=1340428 RepID=A0A6A6V3X2_9PLEO|nr:hypothetical protein M011DRAFT_408485 [Sporormia fimetaria CBS 119925]